MQKIDTTEQNECALGCDSDHDLMLQHVIQDDHELLYMDAYMREFLN